MTPFEEIASGTAFGPAMYELFLGLTKETGRRYPPPAGHAKWTLEASREWLHDVFIAKKGPTVATKLALTATDDDSLRRLARKAIQNAFTDDARATASGAMRKRLRGLLTKAGFYDATEVHAGTEAWSLPQFGESIFGGDWADLLRAPALATIDPIEALNTAGPTSRENAEKIVSAARILLETAGGAVRALDLAKGIVTLFELDDPDLYFLRDTDQDANEQDRVEVPGQWLERIQAADQIWAALSPDERVLVAYLDEPAAIHKKLLPAQADVNDLASTLRIKLSAMLSAEPAPPGALGIVIARSADLTPYKN